MKTFIVFRAEKIIGKVKAQSKGQALRIASQRFGDSVTVEMEDAWYVTTYKVNGGTRFPLDMLRYDSSHPYGSEDAASIDRALDREVRADRSKTPIKLAHIGTNRNWQPTAGRWSSFLWGVDPYSIETHKVNG